MKRILSSLLPLFFIAVSFSSCSKDDENDAAKLSGLLLGKWEIIKKESHDASGAKIETKNHTHRCGSTKDYYEFLENFSGKEFRHESDCSSSEYKKFKITKEDGTYFLEDSQYAGEVYQSTSITESDLILKHRFEDKSYFLLYLKRQ